MYVYVHVCNMYVTCMCSVCYGCNESHIRVHTCMCMCYVMCALCECVMCVHFTCHVWWVHLYVWSISVHLSTFQYIPVHLSVPMCASKCTHVHTQHMHTTDIHTQHTHAQTHAHICSHMYTHMQTHMHTTHLCKHTCTHTCIHHSCGTTKLASPNASSHTLTHVQHTQHNKRRHSNMAHSPAW